MAAFNHIQNMYDISLKPRLLRSLIKEHIPDEKQLLQNPLELSHVVSAIKTHSLLSEYVAESTDNKKQIENWKSAVDAWVNRLLTLVSSNMPDKCWAGICLLGVTCQECSAERFLASYSVWFHKLLSLLQPPAESHFVKVASCVSISDLLTRLSGFPNMKKDGTSHAVKLLQPVLKLLDEDSSDAEGAICLLCSILTFFPSSVIKTYDNAEVAIVSKVISGKCNLNMLKKLGHCLALLPKSRGDDDSWASMMQKILLAINVLLNDAFQGLEEETKSKEAMRVLVPPGKDPPPPLGGQTVLEASDQATRPERLLMPSISALMLCCSTMLTTSYPVQIAVPIRPLLMLVGRVLTVDGSLPHALYPFMTAMQQEYICSELPVLHSYSLDILSGIVKEAHSQLLPHAAHIVRLLTEYFRRCALPELRIKVYSIIRLLLMCMGVGMTIYLTQEVINNAFVDLDSVGSHGGEAFSNAYLNTSSEALPQSTPRKRKHESIVVSLEEQSDREGLRRNLTPVSVKIAALAALEALLTVGGALRSERWRSNVDRLIITVATDTCKGGWTKEETNAYIPRESRPSWADFQLAALRALLASLLVPARVRPPFLSQGLELFRKGMQETGTKLAEFCAHALLALEVLIHPRALPLIDFSSASDNYFDGVNSQFPENIYSGTQKFNSFSGGMLRNRPGDAESEEDDLYESWLRNGDEIEPLITEPAKNTNQIERPSAILENPSVGKLHSLGESSGAKVPKESEGKGKEILVETQEVQEISKQYEETIPCEGPTVAFGGSMDTQSSRAVLESGASDLMDTEMITRNDDSTTTGGFPTEGEILSEKDVLATKSDGLTTVGGRAYVMVSSSVGNKEFVFAVDNDESAMDAFPDIVDVEPDSDED